MQSALFRVCVWIFLCYASFASALVEGYRTYDEVVAALNQLETSSNIAKVVTIGTSVKGNSIPAIKISDDPTVEDPSEPDVLIIGGHHAREWISIEVPLRLAEYLVSHYDDPEIQSLVDSREIWIVPILNPDGYIFTQDLMMGDRFWRKNRRPLLPSPFTGVDPNRNYGFEFVRFPPNRCSFIYWECYRGPLPFSERETQAIRDLIEGRVSLGGTPNFTALLTYHSYGQLILYPWSYSDTVRNPDEPLFRSIAEEMRARIFGGRNHIYKIGTGSDFLGYTANGELTDWAYGEKGILAFTIELPPELPFHWDSLPRSVLNELFKLDQDEIIPTFNENRRAALFFIGLPVGRVMNFEDGIDSQPIRSSIPGMSFTTTQGFDWIYGDERLPIYNVQPAPDPSGPFASNGHVFAWLGPNQGLGQIDFTDNNFKTVGLSYSAAENLFLEGYDSAGVLVDSASGAPNVGTGRLDRLTVQGNIARILVHDAGNLWLIDDLFVTDALSQAQAQLPGKFARSLEVIELYVNGETKQFAFDNNNMQFLNIVLQWPGSVFRLQVFKPDGGLFADHQSQTPPISVLIENAEPGIWTLQVTAVDVTQSEPAALVVGTFNPDDTDNDGVLADADNCRTEFNPDQEDVDADGIGDACDNCLTVPNPLQEDVFPVDGPEGPGNGIGEACEVVLDDMDEDGFLNAFDNCPTVPNSDQRDGDADGVGDACDADPLISVLIDLKPGSDPNSVNPKSKGKIPVAILTTNTFDATTVDPLSVAFGSNGAKEAHGKGHIEDANGDGDLDLVLHLKTQETGIACGDTSVLLTGETFDGTAIAGSDNIVTVSCN
ncbi:MAG: M14 family zinc carboxypeptidase [Gammaproteobacteria bacterium]|nr:M14 family zinc carboxypeptidase [Gammaproteobacteria bacterium]